jgi:hypothetical protein
MRHRLAATGSRAARPVQGDQQRTRCLSDQKTCPQLLSTAGVAMPARTATMASAMASSMRLKPWCTSGELPLRSAMGHMLGQRCSDP